MSVAGPRMGAGWGKGIKYAPRSSKAKPAPFHPVINTNHTIISPLDYLLGVTSMVTYGIELDLTITYRKRRVIV